MTCSRCQSATPNSECYVCASDEDEPDAFTAAKDAAFLDDESDILPPE